MFLEGGAAGGFYGFHVAGFDGGLDRFVGSLVEVFDYAWKVQGLEFDLGRPPGEDEPGARELGAVAGGYAGVEGHFGDYGSVWR